jgi:hypothetical protein
MRRRYVALCLVAIVVAFAYFVPNLYTSPYTICGASPLSKCLNGAPFYSSLTYAHFGSGGVYLDGNYWLKLWPSQNLVS